MPNRFVRLSTFGVLSTVLLAASGCASTPSVRTDRGLVTVTPTRSVADAVVHVRLSGLPASSVVVLSLHSVDADKVSWTSSAQFRTDQRGVVDVDSSPALSGSYTGRDGMGLFWSMGPSAKDAAAGHDYYVWSDSPRTFDLQAKVGGRTVGEVSFVRSSTANPLRHRQLTLGATGLSGVFTWSAAARGQHPAVLLLGGSEGGQPHPSEARALADHGYPVLALAYFGAPGLPQNLSKIPLEYFAHALAWLAQQPQVNPKRLVIRGTSRGSEAALLVGADFPQLVQAVVVGSPSNVALCSYPRCMQGAAWTLRGRDVPFTSEFDTADPGDQPAAVIAVEQIRGPLLLDCGGRDHAWTSCAFAHAILQRLHAHHHPYADTLKEFPLAGHDVGGFFPYGPQADQSSTTFADDQRALWQVWPELLGFLTNATA